MYTGIDSIYILDDVKCSGTLFAIKQFYVSRISILKGNIERLLLFSNFLTVRYVTQTLLMEQHSNIGLVSFGRQQIFLLNLKSHISSESFMEISRTI